VETKLPGYIVTSQHLDNTDELESEWLELEKKSYCSYFQSWGWIGNWLQQIAFDLKPVVIKVWLGDCLVGAGIFVPRDFTRRIMFRSRAFFLNEYPFDGKNMVIEYNGLLAAKGHEKAVNEQAVKYLHDTYDNVDEYYFGAVESSETTDFLTNQAGTGIKSIILERSYTWCVALDEVPPGVSGVLSTLSKNRRGQIRRSIRIFEEQGPIQVAEAGTVEDALSYLDRLKLLHTQRWQSRGRQGVFARPLWVRYHKALILNRFNHGEIQLLKVYNSQGEIGYLYNYIWRGHVYVMQTGFIAANSNYMMPGYVTHVFAIAFNKAKGISIYDFLHGDDLYKRILCNSSHELLWVVIQRDRFRFKLEKLAVTIARSIKSMGRVLSKPKQLPRQNQP
jgi:CelD/BcsL family acetyltransferase involved in cellulose biosynthesis